MSKVQVTGLTVTTPDGSHLYLTMEEAKELFDSLSLIFGRPPTTTVPVIYPIYTERSHPYIYWYENSGGLDQPTYWAGQQTFNSGMTLSYKAVEST
jgi:hypothetical protein